MGFMSISYNLWVHVQYEEAKEWCKCGTSDLVKQTLQEKSTYNF
jgi:hypothetical protein